jgi:hypothetical protein
VRAEEWQASHYCQAGHQEPSLHGVLSYQVSGSRYGWSSVREPMR